MMRNTRVLHSRKNIVMLWTGRITLTGSTLFGLAAVAFLAWFWFDSLE